ncbi:CaiB/BaiF CoA transferase family protein [Leucobacter chinensis]|uniref:CaiB/BaiF CoA transferase family protein n=1 Tax=Leucobacter chinensis TaxID=2851010 RepID=UPI001C216C46|nr:CoA transferase [Leucobacter chinensis]
MHHAETRAKDSAAPLPLTGVKIVDLSRALAGPHCTALLADLGADVVKFESKASGDPSRSWPPFDAEHSLYFDSVNRNKRSVALDFYSDEGRAVLDRAIANADALVENFKPGTLEKMGYPADRLASLNPDLVVASVSGYGENGPLSDRPGLDQVLQAVTGITSVTGPVGSAGYRTGLSIVDLSSGLTAAVGLLAALVGRSRGNGSARVSTSLFETALSLSAYQGQGALSHQKAPRPQGNDHPTIAPYGAFATASDPIVLAVTTEAHWRACCEVLGAANLASDPRFCSGRLRAEHREELVDELTQLLAKADAERWIEALNSAGIPCGPVLTYPQVFELEHTAALGMIHRAERADGTTLPLLRGPLNVAGSPTGVHRAPPLLGEHTREVLLELGYTGAEVDALVGAGKVASL